MNERETLKSEADRLAGYVQSGHWQSALGVLRDLEGRIRTEQGKEHVERVRGPRDGHWWQLYTCAPDLKAEVRAATRELNAALREALAQIANESRGDLCRALGLDPATASDSSLAHGLLQRYLQPVMGRHRDAGAADSEPRDAALAALEDALARGRGRGMESLAAASGPPRSR